MARCCLVGLRYVCVSFSSRQNRSRRFPWVTWMSAFWMREFLLDVGGYGKSVTL